jgi:hypothetical protein
VVDCEAGVGAVDEGWAGVEVSWVDDRCGMSLSSDPAGSPGEAESGSVADGAAAPPVTLSFPLASIIVDAGSAFVSEGCFRFRAFLGVSMMFFFLYFFSSPVRACDGPEDTGNRSLLCNRELQTRQMR